METNLKTNVKDLDIEISIIKTIGCMKKIDKLERDRWINSLNVVGPIIACYGVSLVSHNVVANLMAFSVMTFRISHRIINDVRQEDYNMHQKTINNIKDLIEKQKEKKLNDEIGYTKEKVKNISLSPEEDITVVDNGFISVVNDKETENEAIVKSKPKVLTNNGIVNSILYEIEMLKDRYLLPDINITVEEWEAFVDVVSNKLEEEKEDIKDALVGYVRLALTAGMIQNKSSLTINDMIDYIKDLKYFLYSKKEIKDLQINLTNEIECLKRSNGNSRKRN